MPSSKLNASIIHIKGLVQGVGFRPFIYRLAHEHRLHGWVENRNDGVLTHVEGIDQDIASFEQEILSKSPPAAQIFSMENSRTEWQGYKSFEIRKSGSLSDEITEVSPDIAVCDACLRDLSVQEHRISYPFINCTNCGPRFTIIRDLPYDRDKTTMEPFHMCKICRKEYEDILDRRFHAQPIACRHCGPAYIMTKKDGIILSGFDEVLEQAGLLLESGGIVAVKGLGGFHLACNAQNEQAVSRLRAAKNRDGKPFAVMFSDLDALKEFLVVGKTEEEELISWKRPIMILNNRPDGKQMAYDVSVGFQTTGAMLPYMPFHHLLFKKTSLPVIVLTSGNISDEPIIISDQEAMERLAGITDAIITYNRDIYNRTDDSVSFCINQKRRMIRRSRGFAPSPIHLNDNVEGMFAAGAELVNCFCLGKGKQAIMSQHIGDLKNIETLEFYYESIQRFSKLFRLRPEVFIHDLHPDYLSTKYVLAAEGKKIGVQHHHAHIASCMAEHSLDEPVIGFAFDGVGLGSDDKIWGGEVLIAELADFKRHTHFEYVAQPGGDLATENPWRMALSYLYKYFGGDFINLDIPFIKDIARDDLDLIVQAIDKGINAPLTSSAGRLFDGVSALLGLCMKSSFHAEAPMRLESVINPGIKDRYPYQLTDTISFREMFLGIIRDLQQQKPVWYISTKFHNTIINVIFVVADNIRRETGIGKVVLSGGTFQNRYLLKETEILLTKQNFQVFANERVPSNDGGIALGQLLIGARKIKLGLE